MLTGELGQSQSPPHGWEHHPFPEPLFMHVPDAHWESSSHVVPGAASLPQATLHCVPMQLKKPLRFAIDADAPVSPSTQALMQF